MERWLLIDACGPRALVALYAGDAVVAKRELEAGRGSAQMIPAIEEVLEQGGVPLAALDAVAVVSGPGSFTGVRVGLATAKGLCESTGVRMVAVSRLELLAAEAGDEKAFVALDAGRGQVYARGRGREWLAEDAVFCAEVGGEGGVVVTEPALAARLAVASSVVAMGAESVGRVVLERIRATTADDVLCDANYVRGEQSIYLPSAEQRARLGASADGRQGGAGVASATTAKAAG